LVEEPVSGSLQRREVSWLVLAGLGISYVIGGNFAAWNFGFVIAGWGGMVIAVLLSAAIWLALMMALAELSSIIPTAGGGYNFASTAFGPWAGKITGFAILTEYGAAASAVAIVINSYFTSLTGFGGWPFIAAAVLIPMAIHLRGLGEALGVIVTLTVVAAVGIILWVLVLLPSFSFKNLLDVGPTAGGTAFLPHGLLGIWAALPFATAFFLAVEGLAMAAEEVKDPQHTLPKAMVASVLVPLVLAIIILFAGPGAAGTAVLADKNDPMVAALEAAHSGRLATIVVSVAAIVGLWACLFSALFAMSRQAFALARAGHLPAFLASTTKAHVPANAIVVPSVLAIVVAITGKLEGVFVAMVFAGILSYIFMMAAHVRLRRTLADLPRPYSTPGGRLTSGFALVSAVVLLAACMFANLRSSLATMIVLAALSLMAIALTRLGLAAVNQEADESSISEPDSEVSQA
jgi:ethanolamine permease